MNAQQYLKENPKCDVIHSTSDGNLFYNNGDAVNHAKTLDDKKVETFKQEKKSVDTSSKDDKKLLDATGENTGGTGNVVKVYSDMKVDELKVLLTDRKIEFDPKAKKPELVDLLEESDKPKV